MHHRHLAMGATMAERGGWQQPAYYRSADEELRLLSETVGLCDISPAGKLKLQGSDLDQLLAAVFPGAGGLPAGGVRRVAGDHGPGPSPVVLARLALDEILAVTPTDQASSLAETLRGGPDRCAHVVDLTSALASVRVTGPEAGPLLARVTELDASPPAFPDMQCAQAKVAEVHGTLLRMDLGGVPSFDLYFSRDFGAYMWDALMEAGEPHGVAPVGTDAMARLQR
jgi:sarcosine oxidase subunit alpha